MSRPVRQPLIAIATLITLTFVAAELGAKRKRDTPLISAVKGGQLAKVEALLTAGASVNEASRGQTPLMAACWMGSTEIQKVLIEHGADIHLKASSGHTVLMLIAATGEVEIAELILEKGADVNASRVPDVLKKKQRREDYRNTTALHWAVRYGRREMVTFLISRGAEVNAANRNAHTPLHYAMVTEQKEIVNELLDAGAEMQSPPSDERSAADQKSQKFVLPWLRKTDDDQLGTESYLAARIFEAMAARYEAKSNQEKAIESYRLAIDLFEQAIPDLKKQAEYWATLARITDPRLAGQRPPPYPTLNGVELTPFQNWFYRGSYFSQIQGTWKQMGAAETEMKRYAASSEKYLEECISKAEALGGRDRE